MSVRRPLLRTTCALGIALLLARSARAQVILFNPTVSPAWDSGANWLPVGLPGSLSIATITTSTVGVNNPQSVGAIDLNGGNIGGNGTLTLTSTTQNSTWTVGSLTQAGTLKIGSGHTLAISGSADKSFAHGGQGFNGHIIENLGTITWAGIGDLLGGDGAQFLNQTGAAFRFTNNEVLGYNSSGNDPTFANAGLFEKSGGTGNTVVSRFAFTNTGTVLAQTGTIQFASNTSLTSDGGTFTANAGAVNEFLGAQFYNNGTQFLGAGSNRISGGSATFSGSITANNLIFAGGTALGTAAFGGSGLKWSGGTWNNTGTFTINSGTALLIEGLGTKTLSHGGQGFNGRIVAVSGAATWQDSGQILMGDAAGFQVNAGGTFTIRNDALIGYNASGNIPFFSNNGTLTKQDSFGVTTISRVAVTNTGTLNLQAGDILVTGFDASFANGGTVNVSTGSTLRLNGGGGGLSTGPYNLAFGGRVVLDVDGRQTFNSGTSIAGLGSYDLMGGTLFVEGSATVGNIANAPGTLNLLSGTLAGSGMLTIQSPGLLSWQGGTMNGSGTTSIEFGGTLEIAGAAAKTFAHGGQGFNGRIISNFGTIRWTGTGAVSGGDGALLINQLGGLIDLQADSSFGHNSSGNPPTFANHGILRKSAGPGTFTIGAGTFTNASTGTIDVQSGQITISTGGTSAGTLSVADSATLLFVASPFTLEGGKIVTTGTGVTRIASNVTVSGGVSVGDAAQSGLLQLVNGGTLLGSGVVSVRGGGGGSTLDWNGGSMLGSGVTEILSGGTLRLTGAGNRILGHGGQGFNGRTIDNFGTILWVGSGATTGGDGAALNNNVGATFDVQVASTLGFSSSGNAMTFTNAGTFKKSNGGGTFVYNGGAFNNTGLALVQNGTIVFGSGGTSTGGEFQAVGGTQLLFTAPYTFTSASEISGSGITQILSTTLTVAGGAPSLVSGVLQLPTGSSIAGSGILEVSGELQWNGGGMIHDGITRILAPGELVLSGGDDKTLSHTGQGFNGRRLENFGLLSISSTGNLLLGDQASIDNKAGATLALESGAGISHNSSGLQGSISNSGTFVKRNDSAKATVANLSFTNQAGGVVTSESGILEIGAAFANLGGNLNAFGGAKIVFTGSKTFNGGSYLGSGDIDVIAGSTILGGNLTSQNLNFAGGTISGIASLFGTIEWSGGSIQGSSNLTVGSPSAVLNITGAADKVLSHGGQGFNGSIINNSGSISWLGSGNLRLGDGAQIVNQLSFVAQNDAILGFNNSGNQPLFKNQGSFTKIASGGITRIEIPFENSGTVLVNSGTLRFTSSFTHTGGFITVSNNATVAFDQGLNFSSGILAGVGNVQGNVANSGTISPGAPVGTLIVNGSLTLLGASNLLIELGGTSQGTGYDLLDVDGAATLGGSLALTFTNGFQSSVTAGQTFTIMIGTGPLTGSFSNIVNGQRLTTLDGFGSFQVNYGVSSAFAANSLVLSNFAAIPEPSTWALLVAGGATVLFMARRRRA